MKFVLMKPDEDGSTGGGAAVLDRGDEYVPPGDDKAAPPPAVAKTDEDDAAAAAAKTDDKTAKPKMLPLDRHEAVLNAERQRREALEAELARYRQGAEVKELGAEITEAEAKIVAMEAEYNKLLSDGQIDKATAKMAEIRRTERALNQRQSEQQALALEARAVERARYDLTVERLEAQFPMLDPKHADFDRAKTAEVLDLKEGFVARGYTPSAALQKAVGYVFPAETVAQKKALTTEARVDPAGVAAARKAEAAARAAETIGKTPPSTANVGENSDKRGGGAITAQDVMKMSYDQFKGLNEETLAKLRGDAL